MKDHVSGVSTAYHNDGSVYYRASVTYNRKHISLGSYSDQHEGARAYEEASTILNGNRREIEDYDPSFALAFQKYVSLVNLRNNGIYFKTPIYLHSKYFIYHITPELGLKFDRDDLFFYSAHTIQQKGGYLFICHYGSQYGILSRYGVHQFAVEGKDYIFVNGDNTDYRYDNIKVINQYMGVHEETKKGHTIYTASIHIRGNYILGHYDTETEAAIAYNKAVDLLHKKGLEKNYIKNYIMGMSSEDYQTCYENIILSDRIINYSTE
ncbi:MAG: hypothetical protein IJ079_10300 [Lachnospiraceae bacterium]|nr:hypothetical protein [Lachnospiraceae bacterium]